jgi:hypothetical protein
MAQTDVSGLTEKEQSELLRLLEEEQENTLVVIHSIPRPQRPGQAPPMMTARTDITFSPFASFNAARGRSAT